MTDTDVLLTRLDTQDKVLDKISTTLHGNGKDGLVVRVDRIEQSIKSAEKHRWVIISALVAILGELILRWIK
jgi:hypothetical protein